MEGFERLCLDTIVQGNIQVGYFVDLGLTLYISHVVDDGNPFLTFSSVYS